MSISLKRIVLSLCFLLSFVACDDPVTKHEKEPKKDKTYSLSYLVNNVSHLESTESVERVVELMNNNTLSSITFKKPIDDSSSELIIENLPKANKLGSLKFYPQTIKPKYFRQMMSRVKVNELINLTLFEGCLESKEDFAFIEPLLMKGGVDSLGYFHLTLRNFPMGKGQKFEGLLKNLVDLSAQSKLRLSHLAINDCEIDDKTLETIPSFNISSLDLRANKINAVGLKKTSKANN